MGKLKPLLPLGDTTILGRNISLFQEAGIEDVRVVVGHRNAELIPVVEKHGAESVFNPGYRKDMYSSVVAGFASLGPDIAAAFILPADIPLVRHSTVCHLLEIHKCNRGKIVRPVYDNRMGHPPILPSYLSDAIVKWSGTGGLREILSQFVADTIRVEVRDECIHFDVDTPEDYEKLLQKWQRVN